MRQSTRGLGSVVGCGKEGNCERDRASQLIIDPFTMLLW